jgi:hypothetical protein
VKGGGHNSAGSAVSDNGFMIDLSLMRRVMVNKQDNTAQVDGGRLLGDVDYETQLYGLAVSAGIVSHTGVCGLTLIGGFGWISRKHGLSIDNLISADFVTADGEMGTASADENQDLFWGNPFILGPINTGDIVVDFGSDSGFHALIVSKLVGPSDRVIGIDMTPEMLSKAQAGSKEMEADNVELR